MDAYIVIGDANTFKSSVIRSLTGCRIRGPRTILYPTNLEKTEFIAKETFVQLSSLQEGDRWLKATAFFDEVKNSKVTSTIFPLRALAHRKREDANFYIDYFERSGWNINIVILNAPTFRLNSQYSALLKKNFTQFTNPKSAPLFYSNKIASEVRHHFGWL